jgi:hypothetical protein
VSSTDRGQKKIFFFFFDRSYVKKHLVVFGLFQVEISEGTWGPCSEVSRWVWKKTLFFFNTLEIYFLWKERIFTIALVFVKKINFELWSFCLKNNFFLKTSTKKSYFRHKYDNCSILCNSCLAVKNKNKVEIYEKKPKNPAHF